VRDQPDDPAGSESEPGATGPAAFEAPHSNGAVHQNPPGRRRHRAPWEFTILALFVLLLCIGIILGWTLYGSRSPERLDASSAAALSAACNRAQAELEALPNPYPKLGADRVARIRAENDRLRAMVSDFATVHPAAKTPADAVQKWSADWGRMIDARARYADALEQSASTGAKVQFVYPAVNAIQPVTDQMDDFVRENHPNLNACFTPALQLEVVEGPRTYAKVTS